MMNVQTMRRVVDDVEAGLVPRVAVAAAARWNGRDPAHVRSSANHVYRFMRNGSAHYLRLTPGSERGHDAIRAELDFVLHAARAGLAVALPVPSKAHAALVEAVEDDGQRCHAVVFEALSGRQYDLGELDEPMVRAWGRTLAQLHRASETFSAGAGRPEWLDEIRDARESVPADETAVAAVLESGLAWLAALPRHEHGLLHGDFELDNLFWDGGRVRVLDFDAAAHGWYAVDVAIALGDVWREGGADRDDRLAWFFAGYSGVRPLPAGARAVLPRLVQLSSALKAARLLRAYATTDAASSPAWVAATRARHRRWLSATRAELEAG
jgi:Ser/Thr protein kinase RdoA (MazF antagonist)